MVIARHGHRGEGERPPLKAPHTPLPLIGSTIGQYRLRQGQRRYRLMRRLDAPPPPAYRCRQRSVVPPDLDSGMTSVVDPRWLPPVGPHGLKCCFPRPRGWRASIWASALATRARRAASAACACRPDRTTQRRSVPVCLCSPTGWLIAPVYASPAAITSRAPWGPARWTGRRRGAPRQTASRALAHAPAASGTCGRGHKETSPGPTRRARGSRAAILQAPTYHSP